MMAISSALGDLYPGALPPIMLFHVPHSSVLVPEDIHQQFSVSQEELEHELLLMTDWLTEELYASDVPLTSVVTAQVSRLVVDVERHLVGDEMEECGMGVIYFSTSNGRQLRRPLSDQEREHLLATYYEPHHTRFTRQVDQILESYGVCLIIDCHSFASHKLPYERQKSENRPDLCIGLDEFHTPEFVANVLVNSFVGSGYSVALNNPFAGSITPTKYFRDRRLLSVMIEVNRKLYLDENTGMANRNFEEVSRCIRSACQEAGWEVVRRQLQTDPAP